MEHGAIDHADAAVGRAAATRVEIEIERANAAVGIVAHGIFHREVVALAGHRHVGVAIKPKLAGPPGHARGQGRDHRPLRRLRFLAAEAAAHAAHTAGHERIRHAQNARSDMLHFARMLGRRTDKDRAVLARHGERDLAFQIKVLLPADADFSGAAQRRRGNRLGGVAIDEGVVRHHGLARGPALLDGDVGRLRIHLDLGAQHRPARRIARSRSDRENRLVMKQHRVLHQNRLVGTPRGDVVLARDVGCGHDGDHAGRTAHVAQIEMAQPSARDRSAADGNVQRADRLRDIIDIFGAALHVLGAAVVRQRLMDMAQRRLDHGAIRRHGRPSDDPRRAWLWN